LKIDDEGREEASRRQEDKEEEDGK